MKSKDLLLQEKFFELFKFLIKNWLSNKEIRDLAIIYELFKSPYRIETMKNYHQNASGLTEEIEM